MVTTTVPGRLVSAAEALIAERGLDGVSLRDVRERSGASNASAVQYHFGGRTGLLRAVLDKHRPAVEARRHALLDQYEAADRDDLRALAAVLVRPLAAELRNPDGGHGYLQLLADLTNRTRPAIDRGAFDDPTGSTHRWRTLLGPLLSPDAVRMHRRFLATQFTMTELAKRARTAQTDDRLYISHLIDLVTALLGAPFSDESKRLIAERRRAGASPASADPAEH